MKVRSAPGAPADVSTFLMALVNELEAAKKVLPKTTKEEEARALEVRCAARNSPPRLPG
jgi:hypothetical protein